MHLGWQCCLHGGVVAWLLLVVVPAADATLIDEFDFPNPGEVLFLRGKNPAPTSAALLKHKHAFAKIVGGERDTFIEVLGVPQLISAGALVGYDPDYFLTALQIQTYGEPGTIVTLQYDGVDTGDTVDGGLDNARGLACDLTDEGINTALLLRFAGSDGADPDGLDLQITATNPLLGSATLRETHYIPNSLGPLEYFVEFTDFNVADPGSFFRQVDSLTFVFNGDGTPNVDYEIDLIVAVSEPATLVLLGFGILIFVAVGRSWQKR